MKKDFICLVIITVLTVLGTFKLFNNQKDYLGEVEQKYKDGMALNLDGSVTTEALSNLLEKYNYIEEKTECDFVAGLLVDSIIKKSGRLPNMGELNQPRHYIPESLITEHKEECPDLAKRLEATYRALGVDDEVKEIYEKKTSFNQGNGNVTLNVKVENKKGETGPLDGILVRLRKHTVSSENNDNEVVENVGYQWTDASGLASFKVSADSCYSVFPIKQGYEYGTARGTRDGKAFADGQTLTFRQKANKMKILDSFTFRNIKADNAMTVRTPAEYKSSLFSSVIFVLIAWWVAYIFLKIMDSRRNKGEKHSYGTVYGMKTSSDYMLFVILMAINCICVLITFGICDPLKDMPNGVTMATGSIAGIVAMCAMACINYVKFRNNKSKAQLGFIQFDFVMQPLRWLGKQCNVKIFDKVPDGFGYLLVALFFVVMLRLFGTGPEGSDAHVNLFFFQPSELSKYFIVIFIAAFFAKNADRIRDFSTDVKYLKPQINTVMFVAVAIVVLMGMYLFLISDMGPALVILVTFIILYSVARQDLIQLVIGVVTFFIVMIVSMVLASFMGGGIGGFLVKLLLPLLWFVVWIFYFWKVKRKIYESAIFLNLLFFMFSFAGTVFSTFNLPGGQRLANRMAMYGSGVWDNAVSGGDQVAQGIWGLAAGGWTGQGLGRGNANFIPAFHTDMVLESVGEVMGFFALLFIVACFFFLIYRSLLLARKAAHPFLFFAISGIALVTLVQFMIILLGSLGLIPLTGVAVPFLSFGRASLIINLAAFGIVISMSRYQPQKQQIEHIKAYDNVLVAGMCSFMAISCCIICVLLYYQKLRQDTYLVKPAAIADSGGRRYFEYNPRISQLLRHLKLGDIYDRNGVVLATTDPAIITEQLDTLSNSGLNRSEMENLAKKHPLRYYPFGDYLFFMLGNYNTKMMWGNTDHANYQAGYFAEERHFSDLRGFDNKGEKVALVSKKFQQSPYLPPIEIQDSVVKRNYNIDIIMAGLKDGVDCKAVKEWNSQKNIEKRKLVLTVDAALQKRMHEGLREKVRELGRKVEGVDSCFLRASVVVLDANQGDLLCSASWPMADQSLMKDLMKSSPNINYKETKGQMAFADRDLGTTYQTPPGSTAKTISAMAAFMKHGTAAQKITHRWQSSEGIDGADRSAGGRDIDIREGLRASLNPFFIKLVNEGDGLYKELNKIYYSVGIGVMMTQKEDHKAAAFNENLLKKAPYKCFTPYYFSQKQSATSQTEFNQVMRVREELALGEYRRIMKSPKRVPLNNTFFAMPWGQGAMRATPLNIARAYSAIVNGGNYMPTRYTISEKVNPVKLMDEASANILWDDLVNASKLPKFQKISFGGKTGTPERGVSKAVFTKRIGAKGDRKNDSWYAFVVKSSKGSNLAVVLRIERTKKTSSEAREWVENMVMPILKEAGYVNY